MMRKLLWLIFIVCAIGAVNAQVFQGYIATTDYTTSLTINQADNATPVPNGWLVQIMIPGANGVIDLPNADGTPGNDDSVVTGVPGNNFSEFLWDSSWTGVTGQIYGPNFWVWNAEGQGVEPTGNVGDNVFLRVYDAATVSEAENYLNSSLYLLPANNVDLYFNTTAHWDYADGFNWQSIVPAPTNPNAASNPTPADAAGDVAIDANLSWEYSGSVTPDGYKLYMGTENPPTIEYDLGNVLTYDPGVDFNYETTYYWQIVPYTTDAKTAGRDSGRTLREARPVATGAVRGDAADCPIWSFTTVETPGTGSGTTTGTGATPTPIPIEPITLPAGTIAGNANVTPPAGNNGGAGYTIDFEIQQTPTNGGLQNPDNVAFTYVISIGGAQVGDTFTFELPYVGAPSSELVWFDGVSWAPVTAPQWDVPGAGFVTFQITITTVGRDGSIEVAFNDGESALPVTLTYFAATLAQQTTANIQWTVESESGIIGYYVLRSETDFASAQGISELVRAENTPFSHSYSFIDDELEYEHTYYYWLESVNADGTNTVWGPQDIMLQGAPAPQLPQVTMLHGNYPNPFNPSTVLKLTVKETETAHLAIFNAKGQEVLSKSFEAGYHEFEWNAEGEASGLYFYKLSSPSYSQVHKMMLLK
jgi:hypothetical protein